ncbi:MAG: tol-pal system protein YbgF [Rhizobiales bacterium]|nr:tol-pal system protein YbgF [Hyphomicrobiales bacterium]
MTIVNRAVLGAAIMAVAFAAAPTPGEAAFWPWQKKKEQPVQQDQQPAPIAPPSDDTGQVIAPDTAGDRMSRIEEQMRTMTGQIEQLTYQLQQLQGQLQQLQASAGGAARKTLQPTADANAAGSGGVVIVPKSAAPDMSNAAPAEGPTGPGSGTPPRQVGALTPGQPQLAADGQPVRVVPLSGVDPASVPPTATPATPAEEAAQPKPSVLASLGDPRADYERAYASIMSGDYDQAEGEFRQFLATFPQDGRAADAQYWLGESLFERGKYREAANEFLNGHKAYPKSDKGPDTLLKLGLSLAGLGERDAACQTYAQVLKQYPKATNAMRTRVATEQASASC